MAACARCGEANAATARFCQRCGEPLATHAPVLEVRKTVSILFCDVVGSTSIGERSDPEAVRRVISRYFDEMQAIVEHHGGTVEKFKGDEVMAVFGVPVVHEDDALRAVRAGMGMRRRLVELSDELESTWGIRMACRIGINTGEVVAGDPGIGQTFVTGDAVNTAKRLEQAAQPGEILIGTATYPLVKDAVRVGPRQRFGAHGKRDLVARFRLDHVDDAAAGYARRLDAPLVGRREELRRLRELVEPAVAARRPAVVSVLGPAGIGKSRLARELACSVAGMAVVTGRCLSYGSGITFWPLVELFEELGGLDAVAAELAGSDGTADAIERLRGVVGAGEAPPSDELFWAVRRILEQLAARRPLLVCLEDLHWAEPTMLDLVEYLAAFARGPLVLLCISRPDLLELRPAFARFPAVELAQLSADETRRLVDALGVDDPEVRNRVAAASEGNPLFAEQLAAMVAESPPAREEALPLPASIHALLAARLDGLEPAERRVLERAAIVGKEFWLRAVADLSDEADRPAVASRLLALARRGLVAPAPGRLAGEDAFRFRHALIREATYAAVPKLVRADLHERFARWLQAHTAYGFGAHDEILGYHLEQAFRCRTELAPADERVRALGEEAGRRLGAAARRALARDDAPAAAALLRRAVELLPAGDPERLALQRLLASTLWEVGDAEAAGSAASELLAEASALGDRPAEAHARLELPESRRYTADPEAARAAALAAVDVFGPAGDDPGLAYAWRRLASAERRAGRFGASEHAARQALRHARAAGDRREESRAVDALCNSLLYGPTQAEAALAECAGLLAGERVPPSMRANVLATIAGLEAMRGEFERARRAYKEAAHLYLELGLRMPLAGLTQIGVPLELLAGDAEAAEREARRGWELLEAAGLGAIQAPLLAEALLAQNRNEEAAAALGELGDDEPQLPPWRVKWRTVRARLDLGAGRAARAVELAEAAAAIAAATDDPTLQADALHALADALAAAGKTDRAAAAVEEARRAYEAKGHVAAARRLATAVAP
jgi:class 3 adenylate cyclase